MKQQKELKGIIHGNASMENLTQDQQRNFYLTLLARILKLYKQKLNKED